MIQALGNIIGLMVVGKVATEGFKMTGEFFKIPKK